MSLIGLLRARLQLPPVSRVLHLFNDAVEHRAELAAVELGEAGSHVQTSLLLFLGAAVFALLTGFAFTLMVAGIVWDLPHRGWWLAGLFAVYFAGTAGLVFSLRHRFQTWRPLKETRSQLKQDHQCLRTLFKSIIP